MEFRQIGRHPGLCILTGVPQGVGSTVQQWEYKIVTHESKKLLKDEGVLGGMSESLNGLGQQGWELVSVAPLSTTQGFDLGGSTKAYTFVFKRQVDTAS